VTEDADLGMRLVKQGYRTAVIQSITLEEANSNLKNWFWQRTRWIKGYIQTYFVHMRTPQDFLRNWKEPHYITFQLVIGGKVMSMFINPLMWVVTVSYFVFRPQIGTFIDSFYPAPILYMGLISLLLGNFLYAYYYMVGCVKHGHDELVKYLWLVPFYWLAMSVAAWVAFYQFVVKPHHWSKTQHGLHIGNKKAFTYDGISEEEHELAKKRAKLDVIPA
jgi:cellulose synthase/poly-beta-1,6-N-acetylglucosamine synthase-like glycosyltransferase